MWVVINSDELCVFTSATDELRLRKATRFAYPLDNSGRLCVHKSEKYKLISMSKHLSSHLLCLCSQTTCWDEKNNRDEFFTVSLVERRLVCFMISATDLVKVPQNVIILTKKAQKWQICLYLGKYCISV